MFLGVRLVVFLPPCSFSLGGFHFLFLQNKIYMRYPRICLKYHYLHLYMSLNIFLYWFWLFRLIAVSFHGLQVYCGYLQLLASEERRHTLQISVSIGVHGRRVPGPIFALKCL
jgi:hypothetical protein